MQPKIATECAIPSASGLQPDPVAAAYFSDAYRAPLGIPTPDFIQIFFDIFGHHPKWIKSALLFRNR